MAYKDNIQTISLEAGSDLSASQYCFVEVAADGQIDVVGDGAHADGVLQDKPDAAGRSGQVAIGGVAQVKCGGTVTRGGAIGSDAAGKAVNAASGDVILGTALETGATGAVISMLFHPRGSV